MTDWFEEWDRARDVGEARRRADQSRYQRYLESKFGDMPVEKVSARNIEAHLARLLADGVGPFTVDASLGILRGVLGTAVDAGALARNPATGLAVDAAPPARAIEPAEALTDGQVTDLANAIQPVFAPLIEAAAELGLSWSEAIGLRVEDVDLRGGYVFVGRKILSESNGKFKEQDGTGRRVSMNEWLSRLLAKHIMTTDEYREKSGGDWLFVTPAGTHPLRTNFNKFYLRPACEKSGLSSKVTFQNFRHTAVRRWVDQGITIEEISRRLGHSQVSTTKRYYAQYVKHVNRRHVKSRGLHP